MARRAASPVSTLQFESLFDGDEAAEMGDEATSSDSTQTLLEPSASARLLALKVPSLPRPAAAAAVSPAAAAAYAAQLAAPAGPLEAAVAAAAAAHLERRDRNTPGSPGSPGGGEARELARALRAAGFDAQAVGLGCMTSTSSGGAAAARSGSPTTGLQALLARAARHAYVVVDPDTAVGASFSDVIIVEPRLREHFEMPRPSETLQAVLAALPPVFVGSAARLDALVTWLAARVRDAFADAGMALPPWRAAVTLQAKWQLAEGAAAAEADAAAELRRAAAALAAQRAAAAPAATRLQLLQRNGQVFTAHVAACTPAGA